MVIKLTGKRFEEMVKKFEDMEWSYGGEVQPVEWIDDLILNIIDEDLKESGYDPDETELWEYLTEDYVYIIVTDHFGTILAIYRY